MPTGVVGRRSFIVICHQQHRVVCAATNDLAFIQLLGGITFNCIHNAAHSPSDGRMLPNQYQETGFI